MTSTGTGELRTIFVEFEPRNTLATGPSRLDPTTSTSPSSHGSVSSASSQSRPLTTLPDDVVVEASVVGGRDWEDTLDSLSWEEGEVLVVGSSRLGTVSRVFLGSNSTKIVRSSPVPVLAIPRGADVHLEETAPTVPTSV